LLFIFHLFLERFFNYLIIKNKFNSKKYKKFIIPEFIYRIILNFILILFYKVTSIISQVLFRSVGLGLINGFLVGLLDGYCYFGGGIYFGRLVGLELINGF